MHHIELPSYNGWVNKPTWEMFSFLSDEPLRAEVLRTAPEKRAQRCSALVFWSAGNWRHHMWTEVLMGTNRKEFVDVGDDLLAIGRAAVIWQHVAAAFDDTTEKLPALSRMQDPTQVLARYFALCGTVPFREVLSVMPGALVGVWRAGEHMQVVPSPTAKWSESVKDWVLSRLFGDHLPEGPAAALVYSVLDFVDWDLVVEAILARVTQGEANG